MNRRRRRPLDPFTRGLEILRDYVRHHATARVPQKVVSRGLHLGQWVRRQRSVYRAGLLTPERVNQLQSMRGWTWDPNEDAFQHGLKRLRVFARRYGHAAVPLAYVDPTGFRLGRWVQHRRESRQRLSASRRAQLEAVRGWTWAAAHDAMAKRDAIARQHLKEYARTHGHTRVPARYRTRDGFALGTWLRLHRRRTGEPL